MDDSERLLAAVAECRSRKSSLAIVGHGSKARFRAPTAETVLSTREHSGIVDYRPEELVVTALAGTPIAELAGALAAEGQLLPFDPPQYGGRGTLGGAIASGLSGPARPWRGSVRDAVLGVEIVNGHGERLRFGGSVMKNVAGYDTSRLMTGAWGTLGVILSASVRLLPASPVEETWTIDCDAAQAGASTRRWAHLPLPVTATCQVDGTLHVRLSGSATSVARARVQMGLRQPGDAGLWTAVRDHTHPFFDERQTMTRLSLPRGCRFDDDAAMIEWGGCQAWQHGEPGGVTAGVFATTFIPGQKPRPSPAIDAATAKYTARIKHAFDPDELFNPGLDA